MRPRSAGQSARGRQGKQPQDLRVPRRLRDVRRALLCRRGDWLAALSATVTAAPLAASVSAASITSATVASACPSSAVATAALSASVASAYTSSAISAAAVPATIAPAAVASASIAAAVAAPIATSHPIPAGVILSLLPAWLDLRPDIRRLRQLIRGHGRLPAQCNME